MADSPKSGRDEVSRPAPITLMLIDDNRLLREGLSSLLRANDGFHVLGAADSGAQVLRGELESPHVVLLDSGLADHDSLALAAEIHAALPTTHLIIMGLVPMDGVVTDYVQAGAAGFIMKDASVEEFLGTIRAVANGQHVLPPQLTASVFGQIVANATSLDDAQLRDAVRLTPRERQVIDLLAEGLSNKAIGVRLHIAVHTVKSHVHNVLEKLALRSRLEVVAFSHGASRRQSGSGSDA